MKDRLHKLWAGFEARAPREKALLVGALLAAVAFVGDALYTGPAFTARKAARAELQQTQQALDGLSSGIVSSAQQQAAQRRAEQAEADQLRAELARLQAESPMPLDGARMLALMEALVARQQGRVQLEALSSLPDQRPAGSAKEGLYRHGVELTVTGGYAALHDYLRALAGEPMLRVRGFELQVREHPTLALKLQVETASTQAAWLTL